MTEDRKAIARARPIAYTIKLPEGLTASLTGRSTLTIKGAKGELQRNFTNYRVTLEVSSNKINIGGAPNTRKTLDVVKAVNAHISKMIEGLLYGYKYKLKIVYSHFPMTTQADKGKILVKNFLGEKFPRIVKIMGATKVESKGQDVTVTGIDLEDVSQTASNFEQAVRIRDKDIRRYQDGIYLTERGNMTEKPVGKVVEIIRGKE